jgi:hypothetical protein
MSTFERVSNWNELCGKTAPEFGTENYYKTLYNQSLRISEELIELQEAINNSVILKGVESIGDTATIVYKCEAQSVVVTQDLIDHWNQEIADALCDLDVVVAGGAFLSGHDHVGAINAVLLNNDAKYTPDVKFANTSLEALGAGHTVKRVTIDVSDLSETELEKTGYITFVSDGILKSFVYSIHRDSDDKICKLIDHPKVDLEPFTNGYKGYSAEMLAEFTKLVDLLDSLDQDERVEGRMKMPEFIDLYGKPTCDKMFLTLS